MNETVSSTETKIVERQIPKTALLPSANSIWQRHP
ncbi:hypothetical protein LINPERHAP1_LOCUS23050, partial [Linum perenne]